VSVRFRPGATPMPVCNGTTDRGHPGHLTKIREARVRDRIVELVGGRVGPRPLALLLVGGDQIGYGVVLADDPAGIRLFRGIARPRRLAGRTSWNHSCSVAAR